MSVALPLLKEVIAGQVFVEGFCALISARTDGEWREVKCQRLSRYPTTTE